MLEDLRSVSSSRDRDSDLLFSAFLGPFWAISKETVRIEIVKSVLREVLTSFSFYSGFLVSYTVLKRNNR